MARRALTASLILAPFAVALAMQGCTQDFSTFDPTGSGGGDATTSTSTSPTTTTGTSPTTTTGPGGGEGGSTTTSSGGGGGSPPTDCEVPADCDDDNPCTDDVCNGGVCERTPVEDGPLGEDDETDCVDRTCEGGEVVETADDAEDPPDTSAPCDITICEEGAPTQVLADAGTSCGNPPLECDGEGVCAGCDGSPANECGDATECSDPTCNVGDGTCDPGFTADDPADPTDGDCKALDCPGDQAEADVVNDDADLPTDLPCSDRGCNAGMVTEPIRGEGMACLAGEVGVCDGVGRAAANCKTCRDTAAAGATDAGCSAATPNCDEAAGGGEGACVECLGDGDCGDGETCDPATDTCVATCVTSGDCTAQVCDPDTDTCEDCASNGGDGADLGCDAADGLNPVCNEGTRTCGACAGAGDCVGNPRGDDCRSFAGLGMQCGCQNAANDCEAGESCMDNVCMP